MPSPPQTATNTVQAVLYWSINGELALNVLSLFTTGAVVVNQSLANSVAAAFKTPFSTLATHMAASTELLSASVRDMRLEHQPAYMSTSAAVPGTGTGDALPRQVALCVTVRTAGAGKNFRGRIYISGFDETVNEAGGLCSQAAADAVVGWLSAAASALAPLNLNIGVFSRPAYAYTDTRTWQLPGGVTQTDVIGRGNARAGGTSNGTAIVVRDLQWDTIRSRNNGRGLSPGSLVASAAGAPLGV